MKDPIASRVARRFLAVNLGYGPAGAQLTQQAPFELTTPCVRCGQEARLALTIQENAGESEYVTWVHPNDPRGEGFWLHDAASFAIYLCRDIDCTTATTLWNQS